MKHVPIEYRGEKPLLQLSVGGSLVISHGLSRAGLRRQSWLTVWLGFLITLVAACAHTPDTSYCRIDIRADEVAITFTFDLATIARMGRLDANADGVVTRDELRALAPGVEKFLRRGVFLELNEREAIFGSASALTWPADSGESIPLADLGQRLTALTFRNEVLHAPDAVAITFGFFEALGERHTILGTFLWKGQENPIIFTRFEPDYLFDTGYRVPAWEQFGMYLQLGISHIFHGYDHIAFLLALLFVRRFIDLLKIITAFSVAHTLTLGLAALDIIALPPRLVESAIAVSIIYVAAENLWRRSEAAHRWRVSFGFGLVHGFGFAAVLRELGLPSEGLVRSLLAFNLGVEVGQVAIAAVCWPLLGWVSRWRQADRVRIGISCVLLAFGCAWLIERAFAVRFMPL